MDRTLAILVVGFFLFCATCSTRNQVKRIAEALEGIHALEAEAKKASKK